MTSKITIEVDFDNGNQPVIQILQYPDSDDVRDKLIRHFVQQLGGSSWCQIKWKEGMADCNRIHISTIAATQLKEQAEIMLEQHAAYEKWLANQEKSLLIPH